MQLEEMVASGRDVVAMQVGKGVPTIVKQCTGGGGSPADRTLGRERGRVLATVAMMMNDYCNTNTTAVIQQGSADICPITSHT